MAQNVTGARENNFVFAEIIQNLNVIHYEHIQDVLGEIRRCGKHEGGQQES